MADDVTWRLSHRADREVVPMADRHYSRKSPGAPQFVPPGRALVLKDVGAYWVTSWPYAEYVHRDWCTGAWLCAAFRRESGAPGVASEQIREAVAITRWKYGTPPDDGMVTLVDKRHVRPTIVHGMPVYGWTFRRAGFVDAVPPRTKGGLLVLQLRPDAMPDPQPPLPFCALAQLFLFTSEQ